MMNHISFNDIKFNTINFNTINFNKTLNREKIEKEIIKTLSEFETNKKISHLNGGYMYTEHLEAEKRNL